MKIERDRAQVVARFSPEEASELADLLANLYNDMTDPEKPEVNWDLADLVWETQSELHEASRD